MADSFGTRLRVERLRRNLTQEQFAQLGGVSRVSQHLYEQDARAPDVNYLLRLGENGVDASKLLSANQGRATDLGELAQQAFVAVDELARNDRGEPLPLDERIRLFRKLLDTLLGNITIDPPVAVSLPRKGARAR